MKLHRSRIVWFVLLGALAILVAALFYYARFLRSERIQELGRACDALHVSGTVPITIISHPSDISSPWYPVELVITNKVEIQRLCDLFSGEVMRHSLHRWRVGDTVASKTDLTFRFTNSGKDLGKLEILVGDLLFINDDCYIESTDALLQTTINYIGL